MQFVPTSNPMWPSHLLCCDRTFYLMFVNYTVIGDLLILLCTLSQPRYCEERKSGFQQSPLDHHSNTIPRSQAFLELIKHHEWKLDTMHQHIHNRYNFGGR